MFRCHNDSVKKFYWQFFNAGIVIDAVKSGIIAAPSFHPVALQGIQPDGVAQELVILVKCDLRHLDIAGFRNGNFDGLFAIGWRLFLG